MQTGTRCSISTGNIANDMGTKSHYERDTYCLLDPLLSSCGRITSAPSIAASEILHEIVLSSIIQRDHSFLRLVHLLDAFNMTNGVVRVLSIGCGAGYSEAYLATRFPHLHVEAFATTLSKQNFNLPNLSVMDLDTLDSIGEATYDFAFSIDYLAHLQDYRTGFRKMVASIAPGKYFYLSVPYASRDEQLEEVTKQNLRGFDYDTLQELFVESGFEIRRAENMLDRTLSRPLNALLHLMDASQIEADLKEIVDLFLLDLKTGRVNSGQQAEGIRFLARRGNA